MASPIRISLCLVVIQTFKTNSKISKNYWKIVGLLLDSSLIGVLFMVIQGAEMDARCGRCGKAKMLTDGTTGERFCGGCGFVVNEIVNDLGPERQSFSKEQFEDRARTGVPTSLAMHDMGMQQ